MKRAWRLLLTGTLAGVLAGVAVAQRAPDADEDVQQRLQRERMERFRELAPRQIDGPAVQILRGTPVEQMILAGEEADLLFIIRGHALRAYGAGPGEALRLLVEADLRSEEELNRAEEAGDRPVLPDPGMVPVRAHWARLSGTLVVLRGGVLRQYSGELDLLAEFDLRTERERRLLPPVIEMRIGPRPDDGPPPPPARDAPRDDG